MKKQKNHLKYRHPSSMQKVGFPETRLFFALECYCFALGCKRPWCNEALFGIGQIHRIGIVEALVHYRAAETPFICF